jgi:hypothetical protein
MTTRKEEVWFSFENGDYTGRIVGKTECGICYGRFTMPEVGTMLHDFFICPSCVLSGPVGVATEAKRAIGDKKRLARWSKDPDEQQGIADQYRMLIRGLCRVKSFYEIRGGMIALAIAGVTAENGSKRFRDGTSLIISEGGVKVVKPPRGYREKRTTGKAA